MERGGNKIQKKTHRVIKDMQRNAAGIKRQEGSKTKQEVNENNENGAIMLGKTKENTKEYKGFRG